MTRPTFSCRNTLQRLRESHDKKHPKEQVTNMTKTVRVEYTVTLRGEDGTTEALNRERILFDLNSLDPEHIQKVLKQELQATEEPGLENHIAGSSLVVTKITELKPTGDDDHM